MVPALTERRWLRFGAFTAFYFAQGVPIGLLMVAIPGWLAEQVSMADLAVFTSVVSAPWGLKLVAGPFMDRFKFLPMGFRRPWVMAAQGGLILSLLALALMGDPDLESLVPLAAICFIINTFAATQDVAVDGMAIDILPEDERGRANAFMAAGQVAGSASFGALSGTLIPKAGLSVAALVCAATVAAIFLFVAAVRERRGERRLPWTAGNTVARKEVSDAGIVEIFRDLLRVLPLPMSLILIGVEFVNRVRDGIAAPVFPSFAVSAIGMTAEKYSQFISGMGLIAAVVGIVLGPVIDRVGARRFLMFSLVASALVHVAAGMLFENVQDQTLVLALYFLIIIATQLIFVAIIVLFMNLCWTGVAATQFSVYMALANLSRTAGGAAFAEVAKYLSFSQDFLIMGGLLGLAAFLLKFFDQASHTRRLGQIVDPAGKQGS